MRYLSICSGIEAATVAWHALGWEPVAFAEIAAAPSAVLTYHWPEVPNFGDFTKIESCDIGPIDVLVGGTPCQSFSVAGLRGGLDDDRGNLALEFCKLAQRTRPRWVLWENVPGVRSLDGGQAFASILGGLVECGYHLAYRELDAQYFGLAQRRKRVFLVGYLGDWRPPVAVLFERESLSWNPPPRRETRKDVAPTISSRPTGGGGLGTDFDLDGGLIAKSLLAGGHSNNPLDENIVPIQSVQAVRDKKQNGIGIGQSGDPMFTLTGRDQHAIAFNGRMDPVHGDIPGALDTDPLTQCIAFDSKASGHFGFFEGELSPPLRAMTHRNSKPNAGGQVAVACFKGGAGAKAGGIAFDEELSPTLSAGESGTNRTPSLLQDFGVRRLTPRECERLQGFPDGHTLTPYRGKPMADGPRYKALGNSFPVPVIRWLGERIAKVDAILDAIGASRTAENCTVGTPIAGDINQTPEPNGGAE